MSSYIWTELWKQEIFKDTTNLYFWVFKLLETCFLLKKVPLTSPELIFWTGLGEDRRVIRNFFEERPGAEVQQQYFGRKMANQIQLSKRARYEQSWTNLCVYTHHSGALHYTESSPLHQFSDVLLCTGVTLYWCIFFHIHIIASSVLCPIPRASATLQGCCLNHFQVSSLLWGCEIVLFVLLALSENNPEKEPMAQYGGASLMTKLGI